MTTSFAGSFALLLSLGLFLGCSAMAQDQGGEGDAAPDPLVPLLGEWIVELIDGAALGEEVKGHPPTMKVEAEGKITGFTGVNRYFGTIDVEKLKAGEFDAANLGMTRRAGPPAQMQLEQTFVQRLTDADAATEADGVLQLTHEGKAALSFRKAAAAGATLADLVGEWTLTRLEGQPLGDDVKDRPPTLTVMEEGKFAGFAGVNRYFGSLDLEKLEAGEFAAGQMGSTMMAGPEEQMALEDRFMKLMAGADAAAVADGVLQLTKDGKPVLTFDKAKP